MKERLTRNISLKILSLLLAVFLWVVILNVDDPVITERFEDIPVTKINENVLKSKDQVHTVISGDTVDVKVKGKRSIVEALRISNFQAVADLSELSVVNAVPIVVTVLKDGDELEIDQETFTMKVSLENLSTKQFRLDVMEKGTVTEGYYVKEKTARPNMIEVSGAESVINKIKEVVVEVDVTNQKESFNETAIPKVYDNNGTLMDSAKLTFNYEEIEVSVDLLKTKTVNLFIEPKGTAYYGYEYVKFEYEPKQVVIAGEQEELDKVQYISGEYLIDNKRNDFEDTVNIMDFIKEDIILIDENQNAVINIDIEKLDMKEMKFDNSEIKIKNLPAKMDIDINNDATISIKVSGNKSALAAISKESLKPYIDLTDEKLGTKLVSIQCTIPESGITISNPSISVTLSKVK